MVTIDTTRADHVGAYGNPRSTTPRFDGLAEQGVLFERAYSAAPITLPSHTTIFTGKVPFVHGVRDNGLFEVDESQTTLAEVLSEHGYRTAAAVGSFPVTARFGIDQGFEFFDDRLNRDREDLHGQLVRGKRRLFFDERRAARVNDALLPWLEENHDEPFFLWAHYFDPHHPHEPPAPYLHTHADNLYLGEIAYADESLGVLLDALERLKVLDRTLVVVTSDHGEGNDEHNESTHSLLVYNSTLHVPLVMRVPGRSGPARVSTPVGTVDITPTILDLLGISIPDDMQGRSLQPLFHSGEMQAVSGGDTGGEIAVEELPMEESRAVPLYAETLSPRLSHDCGELRTWIDGRWKYIHGPERELYDLEADPGELRNLLDDESATAESMRGALAGYIERHAPDTAGVTKALDEETAARLAALGYLHTSDSSQSIRREGLYGDGVSPARRVGDVNLLSAAKQALFSGDPLRAKRSIQDLLERAPRDPHYLELLAQAQVQLAVPEAALETLDRLREIAPGHAGQRRLLLLIAEYLHAEGRTGEALDRLDQAAAIANDEHSAYLRARIVHDARGPAAGIEAMKQVLEIEPESVAARIDLAVWYAQSGNADEAAEYFRAAVRSDPYNSRAFYNYGAWLVGQGRLEDAVSSLQRAIELEPAYVLASYSLVRLLRELGRRDEASTVLSRAAANAPGHELLQELMNGAPSGGDGSAAS